MFDQVSLTHVIRVDGWLKHVISLFVPQGHRLSLLQFDVYDYMYVPQRIVSFYLTQYVRQFPHSTGNQVYVQAAKQRQTCCGKCNDGSKW